METGDTPYEYRELYREMENYERNGVSMILDGSRVSPLQIVTAHMVREEGSYMRDYILNPKGYIESLTFVNINGSN